MTAEGDAGARTHTRTRVRDATLAYKARISVTYTDGSGRVWWVCAPKGKTIANVRTVSYWGLEP